jgi:hypothetical protein
MPSVNAALALARSGPSAGDADPAAHVAALAALTRAPAG